MLLSSLQIEIAGATMRKVRVPKINELIMLLKGICGRRKNSKINEESGERGMKVGRR
jgi:hypothetical protein